MNAYSLWKIDRATPSLSFGADEVESLTGINRNTLLGWYKRGKLEESHERGRHRRYSCEGVLFLLMLHRVMGCGVLSVNAAIPIARGAAKFIQGWVAPDENVDAVLEEARWANALIIYHKDPLPRKSPPVPEFEFGAAGSVDLLALRKRGVPRAFVIDVLGPAAELCKRMMDPKLNSTEK